VAANITPRASQATVIAINTRYVGVVVAQGPNIDGAWWKIVGRTLGPDIPKGIVAIEAYCFDQRGVANNSYGDFTITKDKKFYFGASIWGVTWAHPPKTFHGPPVHVFHVDGAASYKGYSWYSMNGTFTVNGNQCPKPTTVVTGWLRVTMQRNDYQS
jgi:hypothetical protein